MNSLLVPYVDDEAEEHDARLDDVLSESIDGRRGDSECRYVFVLGEGEGSGIDGREE